MKEIKGIDEFLQMSMCNNMSLSVNEKRKIFNLIINLQTQLQQKENIIKEVREYIKSNEKEYGSLEDNEKIILGILGKEVN